MLTLLMLTVSGADTPSRKFRIEAFEPLLRRDGLSYRILSLPDGWVARWTRLLTLPRAGTIFLQKKLIRPVEFNWLKKKAHQVLYDFDDAVYLNPRVRTRFMHIIGNADWVFAGNSVLAEAALAYNRNTMVVPTGLDLAKYRPVPGKKKGSPVIGWIGTRKNLRNLYAMSPALSGLKARRNIRLHYLCDRADPVLNADGWRFVPWSAESEVQSLSEFTIGLMPLDDNEFNRGKCGFKIIQYMAMGIPAIASPVGFNQELITHGKDGFLHRNPEEWVQCVEMLLSEQGKYEAVRRSALERVQDFDVNRIYRLIRPHLA